MKIELWKLSQVKPYPNNPRVNEDVVEQERWLPVSGFENLYEVSSLGRVRRSAPSRTAPAGFFLGARPPTA